MPEETTATTPTEEPAERFRRPVGIVADPTGVCVVCSDGSVWSMAADLVWREAQPIPGSWRAKRWGTE